MTDLIEAAAAEIRQKCFDLEAERTWEGAPPGIPTTEQITDILRQHLPTDRIQQAIANWLEDPEIEETTNRLDQLFRQRHKNRDIKYELKDLLKRLVAPAKQESDDAE